MWRFLLLCSPKCSYIVFTTKRVVPSDLLTLLPPDFCASKLPTMVQFSYPFESPNIGIQTHTALWIEPYKSKFSIAVQVQQSLYFPLAFSPSHCTQWLIQALSTSSVAPYTCVVQGCVLSPSSLCSFPSFNYHLRNWPPDPSHPLTPHTPVAPGTWATCGLGCHTGISK